MSDAADWTVMVLTEHVQRNAYRQVERYVNRLSETREYHFERHRWQIHEKVLQF